MAHRGIKKDFVITNNKVREKMPIKGKTSSVSDDIVYETDYDDVYMVQKIFANDYTNKRAIKKGSLFKLISDDGGDIIDEPRMHSVSLIFQNYKGKDVYVKVRGSSMQFIDGEGNILHNKNTSFKEAKYIGNGEFITGHNIEEQNKDLGDKNVHVLKLRI